jgi:bifunctional DNA-binding transcriptional regulator/antitoxin component of YhaV-PrlF toxin-antitoxin module
MNRFDVEIEPRRKLGLPAEVLKAAGMKPGDRAVLEVRRDGRLVVVPLTEVLDRFAGAVPGLSAAARLPEVRTE